MESFEINKPTEGEEYLMDFFREFGIKYERDKKLVGLKGDQKSFRVADFYLPRFDAYVEFLGLWNKNIKDDDYRLKKNVYKNNGIPCVFLYPENLGILHFTFDKRLQKQLVENGKRKELRKYHWYKLFKARLTNFIILALSIIYLMAVLFTYQNAPNYNYTILAVLLIILFQTFRILSAYSLIFIKNKFSLLKLLE
jgi:hypothetical protein